jgi:hypothetical protein
MFVYAEEKLFSRLIRLPEEISTLIIVLFIATEQYGSTVLYCAGDYCIFIGLQVSGNAAVGAHKK